MKPNRNSIASSAGKSIIQDYKMPYEHIPSNKQMSQSHSHKDLIKHLNEVTIKKEKQNWLEDFSEQSE
jgi:hypothetical protein